MIFLGLYDLFIERSGSAVSHGLKWGLLFIAQFFIDPEILTSTGVISAAHCRATFRRYSPRPMLAAETTLIAELWTM